MSSGADTADVDLSTILSNAATDALAISAAVVESFERRCLITKAECEGLHYHDCQSHSPDSVCAEDEDADFADVMEICMEESCGVAYDLTYPVGEYRASKRVWSNWGVPCATSDLANIVSVFDVGASKSLYFQTQGRKNKYTICPIVPQGFHPSDHL